MKTIVILICLLSVSSCMNTIVDNTPMLYLSVIRDVTDIHKLQPESKPILSLFNLAQNKEGSAIFSYTQITNQTLNPVTTLYLPPGSETEKQNILNTPLYRENRILNFYDSIRKIIDSASSRIDTSTLGNSECLRVISSQLEHLERSNSRNKILCIYSNLYENSEIASVYGKTNEQTLIRDPIVFEKKLESSNLLPASLKNITVFLLYRPLNREDDIKFNSMVNIYKRLLEKRGAKIYIEAQNDFKQL